MFTPAYFAALSTSTITGLGKAEILRAKPLTY
jgi:hypothetical protein